MATLPIAHLFREILEVPVAPSINDLLVSILKTLGAIEATQVGIHLVSFFDVAAGRSYIDVWNTAKDLKHPLLISNMFLDRLSARYRCPFQNGIGLHGKEIGRVQTIGRGWRAAQHRRDNDDRAQERRYFGCET